MVNESPRSIEFTGWVWLVCTQQGLDCFGSFAHSRGWALAHLYAAGVGQFWLIGSQQGLGSFGSFVLSRG